MPSRLAVAALAALAPLTLAACEKQNPYVTLYSEGVVVKAQATRYCRGDDCRTTNDVPEITLRKGNRIGIDVPRSLAEQGWQLEGEREFTTEHYRVVSLREAGVIRILRDPRHGVGEWRFSIKAG